MDEPTSAQRILREALTLFSARGYDAASVREICQAAGITKPTLYHFYGSKEGVYRALVEGALTRFQGSVAQNLETPGPLAERLKRMARAYLAQAREEPELMRFVLRLIHNPPVTAPVTDFPKFYEETVGLVARTVDEAVARGELLPGPSDIRMLVLMGSLAEAFCGFLLAGRPELTPELADALVDAVLHGWIRA